MASDEQFSLCWNNFHSNMSTGFHGLLSRGDLVDVTLAAEGRMLQAHKIVLSVCSPYFQDLFKMNPTQHPIVFLKDVSYTVLKDLLQFMYQGEVNVKQEELASFISTAEQLQVKGLTGNQTDDGVPTPKPKPSPRPGPRSSQQRQAIKPETDVDTKQNPVAIKRPSRPSATPSNASSSQPAPAKRKCIDPLEPGPSGNSKDDFVTIADEDDNAAVAPKMEPEFNDALWEDDDDGTNNDDGNFGEDDSNLEMSGFGDGSVTGDTTIAGATGEGGAVGDAQVVDRIVSQMHRDQLLHDGYRLRRDRILANGDVSWRCTQKKCSGRVKVNQNNVIVVVSEHNHASDPDRNEAFKIVAKIRQQAIMTNEKPLQIIQQAEAGVSSEVASNLPKYTASKRLIQRQRNRHFSFAQC
ncbi:uncharacterized protein LOC143919269 isoform X6 [Arctopsyche grandis]|uniref:uncharacterized protein LOC143919269 isoform X6 n=1 Tax=Arctopsyche grandis TaxID=121162 RepID=UPI00406D9802